MRKKAGSLQASTTCTYHALTYRTGAEERALGRRGAKAYGRFCGGLSDRADAERFFAQFRKRLVRFNLELHPEAPRPIEFGRSSSKTKSGVPRENMRPSSFWGLRTSVVTSRAAEPLTCSALRRRTGWLRSSLSSRQSFNAGSAIARVTSASGLGVV
jgi:hypothetical protein